MMIFAALAAVLTLVAIGLMLVPLLRPDGSRPTSAAWVALGCAAILFVGSAILYATLSKGPPTMPLEVSSPEAMVASLAQKLNQHPNDLDGWMMLGRSYMALREYLLAVSAYRRANELSGGRSAEALVGEAEALTAINGSKVTARAGELIEQALALDPTDPHALFYGGIVARQRGDLRLARQRFAKLLTLDPPAYMRTAIEAQIEAVDRGLSLVIPALVLQSATTATPERDLRAGASVIRVEVELARGFKSRVSRAAVLYVFVRNPVQEGPPLAAKRLQDQFPQTVQLTSADAMIPGHGITNGEHVQVVARISLSGNPMDESGDLSGQADYWVGHEGLVAVMIDHVTP